MNKEEREKWLKSLKIGDQVCTKSCNNINYDFYTIINITKKGKIRLSNNVLLSENGEATSGGTWDFNIYYILPVTEEVKIICQTYESKLSFAIKVKDLINDLNNTELMSLTFCQLMMLEKILNEAKGEKLNVK